MVRGRNFRGLQRQQLVTDKTGRGLKDCQQLSTNLGLDKSCLCAGVTLVAYSISKIVTEKTDEHSDRLLFYGEPTPKSIGPLRGFLDDGGTFQKMIFMTTEEHLKKIRPQAIAALEDSATLTTALPGMLEVRIQRCLSRQLSLHALAMLT